MPAPNRHTFFISTTYPRGYHGPQAESKLLGDDAASDAVARVARWIGLHVVRLGVDHQRRAAVGEDRIRAGSHIDVGVLHGDLRGALGADGEIGHVAGVVAFGILHTVLLAGGIEVT